MSALPGEVEATAAAIRRRELERAYARLGGRQALDPTQRRAIEALADALVAGVLRPPAVAIQAGADPADAARLLPTEDDPVATHESAVDGAPAPSGPPR